MNGLQPVTQGEPRRVQRRPAGVGQGAAHGQTIAPHRLCLGISPAFQAALDRADTAHPFLEFRLGVPVGLRERARGFAQVMELAELMRDAGQRVRHGLTDLLLPIGDDADNGHGQRRRHLTEHAGHLRLRGAQQAARQQHFPREDVAHHP
jgi:hypothetical protein